MAGKVLARMILLRQATCRSGTGSSGSVGGETTVMAIAVIRHILGVSRRKGLSCCLIFLDISKAYDTVDRERMWDTFPKRLSGKALDVYRLAARLPPGGVF